MKKEGIKKKVVRILKSVYKEYKNKGLITIYLWGTITNNEYIPNKSDIDCIGITKNKFNGKFSDKIINLLSKKNTGISNFNINFIYLNELNKGKIRSRLTKVIHPNLLLMDFYTWEHVSGKKFLRENFKGKEWSLDKAINYRLNKFKKSQIKKIYNGDYSELQYLCKNLLRVCHLMNQTHFGLHPFRYKELKAKSDKQNIELITILLELKKSEYDEKLFKKKIKKITKLVEEIIKRLE